MLVELILLQQDREEQEERVGVERVGVVPPQEVLLPVQTAPMVVVEVEVVLLDRNPHLFNHLLPATEVTA